MRLSTLVRYVVCAALIINWGIAPGKAPLSDKRILLLYSYHPGFFTAPLILKGVESVFNTSGPWIDIRYMDAERRHDRQSLNQFFQQLSYKSRYQEPHGLLIAAGENVPGLVVGQGSSHLEDVPKETHWVNTPEGESYRYKQYFFYTLFGMGFLLLLLLLLYFVLGKYRQLSLAIKKSEEQHRTIVENSHDGIWQIDSNGRTTFVNQIMVDMLGYSVAEMMGKSFYNFMDDEAKSTAQNNLSRRRDGIAESHEFKFQHKQGHDVWTRMNASPLKDNHGRFVGALAMVSDINEIRKERIHLRESEEKFHQLTHAIREVFWLGSPDWQEVFYISPGYELLWGRSRQSLYEDATSWLEALPIDDRGKIVAFIEENISKTWRELVFPDYRISRPDGEERWISARAFAILDDSGELYRVAGIAEDVTLHKQKEQELSHRLDLEQLLAEQASRLLGANVDELDQYFDELLEMICGFSGSDRAYLFQFDNDHATLSNTHEWCAQGIRAQKETLQNLPISEFEYMLGLFADGNPLLIKSLDELPASAADFKQHLADQQIQSLLAIPILIDQRLAGLLGFDAVGNRMEWQQEDVLLLQTFSDVLGSAIKRQRTEAALCESRRTLQTLLDNLPGAAYRCENDKHWSMQFISDGITEITGYQPTDLVGNRQLSYADVIHQDDKEPVAKKVSDAIGRNMPFEIEYRIIDRWKQVHWVWEKGALVESELRSSMIEGFITDISERKRMESALTDSEDYLRLIMNSVAESIYTLDEQGRCTSINKTGVELLGYEDQEELVGQSMHQLMHDKYPDGSPYPDDNCPIMMSARLNEQVHLDNEVFWRKDGSSFPVECWSYPLNKNNQASGVVVTFIDITERRFHEELMESRVKLHDFAQGHDMHSLLVFALDEACEKTGSKIGFFHFLEADQKTLTLQAWSSRTTKEYCHAPGEGQHYDVDEAGVWADTVRERRPVIHNDYASLAHKKGLPKGHAPVFSELCVPVFRGDRIVAVMGVGNRNLNNYNDFDVDKVSKIADLTWDIVESKQFEERLEQSGKQLNTILDTVSEAVALWDQQARLRYANPAFFSLMEIPSEVRGRDSYIGKKLSELTPGNALVKNVNNSLMSFLDKPEPAEKYQLEVQLVAGDVRWVRLTIHALYDINYDRITGAVSTMINITEEKNNETQLEQLAHYDSLTKLPNRLLAIDRLRQMIARSRRTGELMAICYLDLDGFKQVNDSLGHEAGDELLKQTAERLEFCVRNGDTVSRLGGDEFLILLADLSSQQETRAVLDRILEQTAKPYVVADSAQASVSASLGITLYPSDEADADGLVHQADQAMYLAKKLGKNRYQFFNTDLERRIRDQEETVAEIVKAMDGNHLVVHYQPVIDCRERRVIAAEALIRWDNPVLGLLEPAAFLPLINHAGIKLSISEWIIGQVVGFIRQMGRIGLPIAVSINIFPEQSYDPNFIYLLRKHMEGLSHKQRSQLQIEISEQVVASHFEQVEQFVSECLGMGVECVLDDLGVGDISIQQLARLPVKYIKIDRMLTKRVLSDQRDYALIKSILGVADAFERKVIVPGVEGEPQYRRLHTLGCGLMQGYFFSQAMPEAVFKDWVTSISDSEEWAMRFAITKK